MAALAMALPIFAITLFVSAFLLFLVQPMVGKMILPNLGGTPQVWNTCMMFFQSILLAGYAYTHFVSTRLKLHTQLKVHGALLFVPLLLLLVRGAFSDQIRSFFEANPISGQNPIAMTLLLLFIVVGIPFFVVSTSAPLLQKWFTYTGHPAAKDPYFLYGASNLGSMLALVFYPALLEPWLGLYVQSWTWAIGYFALVAMFFVCVAMVWAAPPTVHLPALDEKPEDKKEPQPEIKDVKKETGITAKKPEATSFSSKIKKGGKQKGKPVTSQAVTAHKPTITKPAYTYTEVRSDVITPWRRLHRVLLAFVPSSLMLGIITYISTDVSAIPLFWVIPLALYLLSFILVFSRWPVVWTRQAHTLMVVGFPFIFVCFLMLYIRGQISPVYRSIAFSILTFFLTAMVCHGEMARDRPSPKHLTEFYLWMSVGGMLGGVFNGLFAPIFFWGVAELPIALVVACFLRPYTNRLAPLDRVLLVAFAAPFSVFAFFLLWGGWMGLLIGIIIGVLVAAFITFDPYETNGWSENLLLSAFPSMGEWFDEKGRELKEEAKPAAEGTEEQPEPAKKVVVKAKGPPDYYVLNYTLDVALPLIVLLLMWLLYSYTNQIYRGLNSVFHSTLGMDANMAQSYASQIGSNLSMVLPLACALLFAFRPLRFALAIMAILVVGSFETTREGPYQVSLTKTRSYFGVLSVYLKLEGYVSDAEMGWMGYNKGSKNPNPPAPYTYLMHGTTHHGLNYQAPQKMRRLATTYYHRLGPVGVIMDRMEYFKNPEGKKLDLEQEIKSMYVYPSDARMPVTLAISEASQLNFGILPTSTLVALWTEPPYACIGLGTGTMSSYAHPLQHMTFYEIDNTIKSFSLGTFTIPTTLGPEDRPIDIGNPPQGPYFNYLHDAMARGANIEIVMGDARLSQKFDVEELRENEREAKQKNGEEWEGVYQHRDNYYHTMEVDAFSSDAIPVHLITEESIAQYMKHLVPNGVLMVHTSNRHVELVDPVSDVAQHLELKWRVAHDHGKGETGEDTISAYDTKQKKVVKLNWGSGARGHFQSEYIMLANKEEDFDDFLKKKIFVLPPASSKEDVAAYRNLEYRREVSGADAEIPYLIWTTPPAPGRRVWTDDYSNMMSVFRWGLHF